MNENTCSLEAIDGSEISRSKSVFSYNSRCISAACEDHVRVYSVGTGELLHTLRRHEAQITGICMHPKNPQQLVSVSLDGKMILWDPADGTCMKMIHFKTPLYGFCFRPNAQEDDLCLLIKRKSKRKMQNEEKDIIVAVVLSWAAVCGSETAEPSPALMLDRAPSLLWNLWREEVAFTHQGSHLVGFSRKHLLIYDLDLGRTVSHRQDYRVSCVATHPFQKCIATGNEHGQIFLWYDFLNPDVTPLTRLLHWHAHCVNDICFTHDGAYLLSVGIEAVLVLWQVDTLQTHFQPRLGSAITSVSTSPKDEWIALGMQNNVIKILSAHNNEVVTTAGGLRKAYLNTAGDNGVLAGLRREPQSDRLVLNSSLGHIQLYSPLTRHLSEEVSVTSLNFISQADDQAPVIPTVIAFVSFSDRGQWMATVELRDDKETAVELRMKFWAYKHNTQSYELSTLVDPPHLGACITGLLFQPVSQSICDVGAPACVTTATNGHFKVWRWTGQTLENAPPPMWACSSESHYLEEPALGCSFSEDSSLLAVLYENHLTLWRAETSQLKKVFLAPGQNEKFKHVWFGSRNCSHFLVASSSSHLTVWNLLSSGVYWSVQCDVEHVVGCPFSSHMAAFVRNGKKLTVCVFTPESPTPLSVHEDVCHTPLLGAVFLKDARVRAKDGRREEEEGDPHWSDSSSLYFLSPNQVLLRIGRQMEKARQQLHLTGYEGEMQTAFEQIFGWRHEMESVSAEENTVPISVSSRTASKLFSGPPHALPPVSSLCSAFLATLAGRLETKREAAVEVSETCDDDVQDDDSASESSDSGLRGDVVSSAEERHVEQKMDTSRSTTAPTGSTTAPSAACDSSIAVGNFTWLTDVFKSIK